MVIQYNTHRIYDFYKFALPEREDSYIIEQVGITVANETDLFLFSLIDLNGSYSL